MLKLICVPNDERKRLMKTFKSFLKFGKWVRGMGGGVII